MGVGMASKGYKNMATTVADVLTYARQITQTDSNGLTDTAGLAFASDAYQNFTRALLERDIDAAQTAEAYANLTTTNPNTYAWPADMFSLKTIEVNMTDTNAANFITASRVDVANIQNSSFDALRLNQPPGAPLFDNRGDTVEIFPVPPAAIVGGLKIIYFQTPTDFASTSTALPYPLTLDYRCLAARVAALYSLSQDKTGMKNRYSISVMTAFQNEYEMRLKDIIKILAPGSQQPIQSKPLSLNGWNL